jgi:hypothetical protein
MDGAAPWSLHEILRVTSCDTGTLNGASLTPFAPLQPRLPSQRTMAALAQHAPALPAPAPAALAADRRPLRAGRCQVPDCTTPDEGSRAYNQRCRCVP